MAIPIKSPADIEGMRRAGALLWRILEDCLLHARAQATTSSIESLIASRIVEAGADPVMRTGGFPGAASITVNEEVAHAPPGPRRLREGDLVTIDASLRLDGWCADAARAFAVGDPTPQASRLLGAVRASMESVIAAIRPGVRWSQVARAVLPPPGGSVIREYAGHGIGRALQEPPAAPFLPNSSGQMPSAGQDFVLRPGMVLTVEPVLALGRPEVLGLDDAWTVVTADRSAAAHEERTVAVIRGGALVLTAP